jgi:UDP-N-acetylglucosamine--N-acetylmuramyl-(pentapeptide) pyrophosphoryl-undecaprenol N-acetylglucosamine transferase
MPFEAEVVAFIDDIPGALHRADLVVARSGAMTVTDLMLAARAAIFVPYPFHKDEQQVHNARALENVGGAIIVRDDEHLAANLASELNALANDPARIIELGKRAHQQAHPDAAKRVAQICFEVANSVSGAA